MAKRNPNDRNEIAVEKARRQAEDLDHFTLSDGRQIELKNIDPIFLQGVLGMVEQPDVPLYDVTLASGRIVQYPMDEKVAEQTPELMPVWRQYILEATAAAALGMKLMTSTMILDGTVVEEDLKDPVWERKMKLIGAKLPTDPTERWVLYLRSKMTQDELLALTGKIMRRTGVPEEYIAAAEATFPDPVPGGSERSDDLAEPDADPQEVAGEQAGQVAAQQAV